MTITGGTFDGRVDVRMNGGDTFTAKAFPTLNEARLREGDNGPIRRTFHLPSPVDVVISTVEDADGSITFPLEIPIDAGKLDTGAVVASAVGLGQPRDRRRDARRPRQGRKTGADGVRRRRQQ